MGYSFILALFSPTALSLAMGESPCPLGWMDSSWLGLGCLNFNGSHFYSWMEAEKYCAASSSNATLLEIATEEQFDFVRSVLTILEANGGKKSWWTSGADWVEGRWIWLASLGAVGDFIWDTEHSEPNGGTESNCLYLNTNYGYKGSDTKCSLGYHPICQFQI